MLKLGICLLGTLNIGISALSQFSTHKYHYTEFDLVLRVRCYIILAKEPSKCTICDSCFLYRGLYDKYLHRLCKLPSVFIAAFANLQWGSGFYLIHIRRCIAARNHFGVISVKTIFVSARMLHVIWESIRVKNFSIVFCYFICIYY